MYYYVKLAGNKNNTADVKAPEDMCRIMQQRGYQPILFKPIAGKPKMLYRLTQVINWTKVFFVVKKDDMLIYQYPLDLSRLSVLLLKALMRTRQMTVTLLIHDIDSIRGYYKEEENKRKEDLLKHADYLICHNKKMKEWLIQHGISESVIVSMEAFDYLLEGKYIEPSDYYSVIIAGNLGSRKSPFLSKYLAMEKDYQVNLFGPYFEFKDDYNHYQYYGSFPPQELIEHLKGGFGLVWDGDSIDDCNGSTGQYLKYNNPHKAFSYIAAGIPVIIWEKAALSEYIIKKELGFTVNNLTEISHKLREITQEEYQTLCENAVAEGEKLRKGYYLNRALDMIEEKAEKKT